MTPALSAVHVIGRLQDARERVAHGWPSLALSIAGHPLSSAQVRLAEAEAARYVEKSVHPWVLVLTEALVLLEEAREIWGNTPDIMPPAAADLAPCGAEMRLHLPGARAIAGLPWEDPGGITRPQALCVAHLAVCLARWRAEEQRVDVAAARARADLDRERQQSSAIAARAIWGAQPKHAPEPVKEMRSLRDLAAVSSAFSDWGDEEES